MVWGFFVVFVKPHVYLQSVNTKFFYCTGGCSDDLTQHLIEKKLVGVFKTLMGYTNLLGTYRILHLSDVITLI